MEEKEVLDKATKRFSLICLGIATSVRFIDQTHIVGTYADINPN